jgi:hypothetical protein
LAQDDQTQVLDAFRSFTVSFHVANFDNHVGQFFVALPGKQGVGEDVLMATQIVPLPGTPARFDYTPRPEKGEDNVLGKAIDIVLDGYMSQVAAQHSGSYGLLYGGSVTKLIATLHRKTTDLSGGALSRPAGNAASEITG